MRGFVCRRCNFLLGVASDDPELLLEVLAYLANSPRAGSYKEFRRKYRNAWLRDSPKGQAMRKAGNARWREKHKKVGGQWVLR